MKKMLSLLVILGGFTTGAQAADEPPQSCDQIRDRIQAVTGLVSTPSMDLLKQIAMGQACNFSSAEVYRAAYGDKPLPQPESHDPNDDHENDRERDDD